jgi:hypothetical protein
MANYDCEITTVYGDSWPNTGTETHSYSYEGAVNMNGYSSSMVDSVDTWACEKK